MDENRDRLKPAEGPASAAQGSDEREARLAAALRANLRRRKAAAPAKPPAAERGGR